MQIMIEIPDEKYERLAYIDILSLRAYIENGKPLPKGHGDLIDKKEVYKKFYCRCLARVAKEVLEEIPTIIEADRSDEE